MSAIELWAFLIVVACVGINLALDRSGDDVMASTRFAAKKPPTSR